MPPSGGKSNSSEGAGTCEGSEVELAKCIQRSEATVAGVKCMKGREVDEAGVVRGQGCVAL